MEPTTVALLIGLVMSIVLHEVGHAYAANWLGDPTARLEGRLSVNPLVHIDWLMSVIIPGFLVLTQSPFLFGAAKPVPYNPYNFRNQKWGEAIVAVAGPAVNIGLAVFFTLVIGIGESIGMTAEFLQLCFSMVVMNLFLAFFNLVPIPPLDGSKILPRFLPFTLRMQYEQFRAWFESNILMAFALVFMAFVLFLGGPLYALTFTIANAMVGLVY
jgi:Zn-dependent protease